MKAATTVESEDGRIARVRQGGGTMEHLAHGQPAVERLKTALLEAIQAFLEFRPEETIGALATPNNQAQRDAIRTATAALLLQISRADFDISGEEREGLTRVLENLLGVTAEESRAIVSSTEEGQQLFAPLQELTGLLDRTMSVEQKRWLLESLWQVAFADAEVLAHEEYLVRKIADLLHLSTADLIEAKIRAKEHFR